MRVHEKAVVNQDEMVEEVLANDPTLASWVDAEGYTVLQRLCAKGDKVKILQLLVKNGASLDYQEPKHLYTALMLAAKCKTDFVNYLLKSNANPLLKSKRGKSAAELTKIAGLKTILQKAESTFDEGAGGEVLSNTDSEGASMLSTQRALQPEGKNRRPFGADGKGDRQQSGKSEVSESLKRQGSVYRELEAVKSMRRSLPQVGSLGCPHQVLQRLEETYRCTQMTASLWE